MTDAREPLTVGEVAARWRVSSWTVAAMTRDGRLAKIPGLGRIRIPLAAVEALEGYDGRDVQSDRPSSQEAAPSRGRQRHKAHGSLAVEAVGSGRAVSGRVGPSEGDVVRVVRVDAVE